MIYQAAEIVKHFISEANLSFVDKIAGLVKTYEKKDGNGNVLRLPIAYNLTETQCQTGKYFDLAPDSKSNSAIYFEGDRMNITRSSSKVIFTGDLKLVCWMNLEKLGYATPFNPYAIPQVIQAIPTMPINFTPDGFESPQYQKVVIHVAGVENENLFSKYTYAKKTNFFPYDYFAINLTIQFEVNYQCLQVPEPGGESCS